MTLELTYWLVGQEESAPLLKTSSESFSAVPFAGQSVDPAGAQFVYGPRRVAVVQMDFKKRDKVSVDVYLAPAPLP